MKTGEMWSICPAFAIRRVFDWLLHLSACPTTGGFGVQESLIETLRLSCHLYNNQKIRTFVLKN
jgi:hypothetical protein